MDQLNSSDSTSISRRGLNELMALPGGPAMRPLRDQTHTGVYRPLRRDIPVSSGSSTASAPFKAPSTTEVPPMVFHTALAAAKPIVETETETLIKLSAPKRWAYILHNRPSEFFMAAVTISIACYILVDNFYPLAAQIMSSIVSPAYAQDAADNTKMAWDLRTVIAMVMAVGLLWTYGIISFATVKAKLDIAKESQKFLHGFLAGVVTGKIPK